MSIQFYGYPLNSNMQCRCSKDKPGVCMTASCGKGHISGAPQCAEANQMSAMGMAHGEAEGQPPT